MLLGICMFDIIVRSMGSLLLIGTVENINSSQLDIVTKESKNLLQTSIRSNELYLRKSNKFKIQNYENTSQTKIRQVPLGMHLMKVIDIASQYWSDIFK